MKYVQTVKGPIPEDKLGKTLMHEHCVATSAATYLAVSDPDPKLQEFLNEPITPENRSRIFYYAHKHRENAENRDENLAITELKYFKAAGGSTIVGVKTLEEKGFRGAVMDCVKASYEKSVELGKK